MLERWRERDVFRESIRRREGAPPFTFYEGPPTANGRPGSHHVLARVFKDVFPRFKTMRGHQVDRKGGWDCHGLPVELEVERELGFKSKDDIEAFGIAEFNARCRESVLRYIDEWNQLTERIGFWLDTDDAYYTLANEYIESVWWSLKQVWEKGLLSEGHKVVPYCPRCGTALSSHEVAMGYKDVVDPSVFVRFPIRDEAGVSLLGVDHHAVDAAAARRARRRPGGHLRPRPGGRRDADPGRGAGRAGARRGRGDRRAHARLRAARHLLRAAVPLHHRLRPARPHRAPGRLRLDRGRHGRRAHGSRVRRGRLPARGGQRPHDPQSGASGRHLRRPRRPVRGPLRARGRPRHRRGAARVRPPLPRRRVRARLPALLALPDAASLLRQVELVRAHDRGQG